MGKVYLVGAGPGDPGLITVKGLEILRRAEVIIYDYLVDKRILEEASPYAELICADQLGKKRYSNGFSEAQTKINKLMIKKVKEGKRVVRLKNGDTAMFSRLSEELEALNKNRIKYEVVPGITAASAAACYNGVPLTDRRFASSVVFVTGHESLGKDRSSIDWKSIAGCGTIVLYMAVENISKIADKLISAGKPKDTAVLAVSKAAGIAQRTAKGGLESIGRIVKEKGIKPPSVFIIGETVKLEKKFNWLGRNKRVLFTGLSKERYFVKETYFHIPLIKIVSLDDYKQFDNYLKKISGFDWIVFTSRYGVEYFFKRLKIIGCDSRVLKDIKIAVIGNSTKNRLDDYGVKPDLIPDNESALGLLKAFKDLDVRGKKMFLPRSDISDKGLVKGLSKMGAFITESVAYRNIMPENLPDLDLGRFSEIMFTSPSGVRNFVKRYGRPPKKVIIKCIGDVTKKQAEKLGLNI